MTIRKKLAFTVIAILLMAGCGQRGPLYLPEPATTNQPAEPSTTDVNNEQGV